MNGYLLDTNIPSEIMRPRPEPKVEAFMLKAGKERVYLGLLSLANPWD
jgi:predicted nucleic acid-binding protein